MTSHPSKNKTFVVIDSYSLMHRAYHALPPLRNQEGEVLNAGFWFYSYVVEPATRISPSLCGRCF